MCRVGSAAWRRADAVCRVGTTVRPVRHHVVPCGAVCAVWQRSAPYGVPCGMPRGLLTQAMWGGSYRSIW
eukprot:gene11914-biopygen6624